MYQDEMPMSKIPIVREQAIFDTQVNDYGRWTRSRTCVRDLASLSFQTFRHFDKF